MAHTQCDRKLNSASIGHALLALLWIVVLTNIDFLQVSLDIHLRARQIFPFLFALGMDSIYRGHTVRYRNKFCHYRC